MTTILRKMSKPQILNLIFGGISVLIFCFSLAFDNSLLGYTSIFLGKVAGLFYLHVVDRTRPIYFFPLVLAVSNILAESESLLFTEMLISGVIYQISAYNTFYKMNK